jgi:hypothetical protein
VPVFVTLAETVIPLGPLTAQRLFTCKFEWDKAFCGRPRVSVLRIQRLPIAEKSLSFSMSITSLMVYEEETSLNSELEVVVKTWKTFYDHNI